MCKNMITVHVRKKKEKKIEDTSVGENIVMT